MAKQISYPGLAGMTLMTMYGPVAFDGAGVAEVSDETAALLLSMEGYSEVITALPPSERASYAVADTPAAGEPGAQAAPAAEEAPAPKGSKAKKSGTPKVEG